MNTCIYTKTQFKDASAEHILQNFLGAHWADSTIMCNAIQKSFGNTIDLEFSKGLNHFRTILGTKGGRGGISPPIKHVQDESGNTYHLTAGGQPEISKPIIKVDHREEDTATVQVTIGHKDQLGWALNILKKEHPDLKIDESLLRESAEVGTDYLQSPVKLSLGIGGKDFFRGACKALFNLLGVREPQLILRPELDRIRDFIVSGKGENSEFIGWPTQLAPFPIPSLGPHDHFISVWSGAGKITGLIQLFGEIPFIVELASEIECADFCYSYLVNPHRDTEPNEDSNCQFNSSAIPSFSDCPHHPNKEVRLAHKARMERFFQKYQTRAHKNEIESILDDALGPIDGRALTEEDFSKVNEGIMKFLKSKLRIPND